MMITSTTDECILCVTPSELMLLVAGLEARLDWLAYHAEDPDADDPEDIALKINVTTRLLTEIVERYRL